MKFIKIKKLLFVLFFLGFLIIPAISLAACPDPSTGYCDTNICLDTVVGCLDKGSSSGISATTVLPDFVVKFFNWTARAIGTFAVLGLVYAGYTYSTSAGNPDKIKLAKDIIITSLTGIILVIFSFALFRLFGLA